MNLMEGPHRGRRKSASPSCSPMQKEEIAKEPMFSETQESLSDEGGWGERNIPGSKKPAKLMALPPFISRTPVSPRPNMVTLTFPIKTVVLELCAALRLFHILLLTGTLL